MACSSSDSSPTSSSTSSTVSDQKIEKDDGTFWTGLAQKARSVMEDNVQTQPSWKMEPKDTQLQQRNILSDALIRQNQNKVHSDVKWKRQDSVTIHKGLEAIASSLSLLSDTIGTAIEEGLHLVEKKRTTLMYTEPQTMCVKKLVSPEKKRLTTPAKRQASTEEKSGPTKDTQLKASRDVAMAMATKAKLLLRELKNVNADLTFTKNRCLQLDEENKRLRESAEKGVRHEEDDLVRLQLEALLSEKARLAQENAAYARENQFLHEMVQYHQLKLRSAVLPDEGLLPLDMDAAADVDLKDIVALEESVKIAGQQQGSTYPPEPIQKCI